MQNSTKKLKNAPMKDPFLGTKKLTKNPASTLINLPKSKKKVALYGMI